MSIASRSNVPAGKTAKQEVIEERTVQQTVAINNIDDQIDAILREPVR